MDLAYDFLSLFFPVYCAACTTPLVKGEETICTVCIADFPRTDYHQYRGNPIEKRLLGRLAVENAWAFLKFRKEGIVQKLLHELKYNHHPEIGIMLGKIFGNDLKIAGFATEFDLIIPIPLHASRQRQRGYNQSGMFAEGLGQVLGVPWSEEVTVRNRSTQTQTSKTKSERWDNVKDVFSVTPEGVMGKKILLVDDVITTGATIEACGNQLISGGCRSLSIACIAEAQ